VRAAGVVVDVVPWSLKEEKNGLWAVYSFLFILFYSGF